MTAFAVIGLFIVAILALGIGAVLLLLAVIRLHLTPDEQWSPEVVERRRSRVDVRPERRR